MTHVASIPARCAQRCRIVVTGGPGGGKTTAADLFRREIGDSVIVVPESATLLFSGGFPRYDGDEARRAAQSAIFAVQRHLEDVQAAAYPNRILLCDRGTIDGGAYWPTTPEDFFASMGSTLEQELARYDAVIFFESAAAGGLSIEGGNPTRIENNLQARMLDQKLHALWSRHPQFSFVPHSPSFFQKMTLGLAAMERIVAQLASPAP